MKITLSLYDIDYTIECLDKDDFTSGEMQELFGKLLFLAGYPPTVIPTEDGCGKYVYQED